MATINSTPTRSIGESEFEISLRQKMSDKESAIKENYVKNLKAVDYAATMEEAFKDSTDILPFTMKFFKDVLQSGRIQGSSLLEIGSGPLVHNIATASAFFPNIIMSDFVENNCEELKRWLKGESSVKQHLDVPAQLEEHAENLEAGKKILEQRIKQNVKQVVRCDVLNDNILLEKPKPEVSPPYDLILSSLCIEAAVPDFEGFVLALRRINRLLRPGGGLILVGFLQGGLWTVGEVDFNYIALSEEDLMKALSESGFEKIKMDTLGKLSVKYDHEKYYCLAAQKL